MDDDGRGGGSIRKLKSEPRRDHHSFTKGKSKVAKQREEEVREGMTTEFDNIGIRRRGLKRLMLCCFTYRRIHVLQADTICILHS